MHCPLSAQCIDSVNSKITLLWWWISSPAIFKLLHCCKKVQNGWTWPIGNYTAVMSLQGWFVIHKRHCIWVLFLPTEWFCVIDLFDRFSTNFNITEYEKSEDNHSSISRTCLSRTWPVVDKVELWYKVMRISSFFIYVSF